MYFDTEIIITETRPALALLGMAGAEDYDSDALETVLEKDITVSVEFNPGWYRQGRVFGPPENCYPDEGESPEVTSVLYIDPETDEKRELIDSLSREVISDLEERAWDYQNDTGEAYDCPDW